MRAVLDPVPNRPPPAASTAVAGALLVGVLHLWRSNALLTILTRMALYVLATNLLVA